MVSRSVVVVSWSLPSSLPETRKRQLRAKPANDSLVQGLRLPALVRELPWFLVCGCLGLCPACCLRACLPAFEQLSCAAGLICRASSCGRTQRLSQGWAKMRGRTQG